MCERCNYAKEATGWRVAASVDENGSHSAEFITPTGACYHSTAPPTPGRLEISISEVQARIGVAIARLHAA
jgi:hypothetical protein